MDPIKAYLENGSLPESKDEARTVRRKAARCPRPVIQKVLHGAISEMPEPR